MPYHQSDGCAGTYTEKMFNANRHRKPKSAEESFSIMLNMRIIKFIKVSIAYTNPFQGIVSAHAVGMGLWGTRMQGVLETVF